MADRRRNCYRVYGTNKDGKRFAALLRADSKEAARQRVRNCGDTKTIDKVRQTK